MKTRIESNATAILVMAPFGPVYAPSLALSVLKVVAQQQGHRCSVRYSNVHFADLIGFPFYHRISEGYPGTTSLIGEWIFSGALDGSQKGSKDRYFDWVRSQAIKSDSFDPTCQLRKLEEFLADV